MVLGDEPEPFEVNIYIYTPGTTYVRIHASSGMIDGFRANIVFVFFFSFGRAICIHQQNFCKIFDKKKLGIKYLIDINLHGNRGTFSMHFIHMWDKVTGTQ